MKKCKVLSYNPHRQVLVFEYDNKKIQAHFHMDEVLEYVYATCAENGLYEISTKNIIKPKKKVVKTEKVNVSELLEDNSKNIVVNE